MVSPVHEILTILRQLAKCLYEFVHLFIKFTQWSRCYYYSSVQINKVRLRG